MKKLFMSFLVVLISSVSLAGPEVSKIKITCSPKTGSSYFNRELIKIVLDRTALPKITASFYKIADKYSDYMDPIITTGDLSGTEYFEVVTLQGTVKNEFQSNLFIKMRIQNGTLHFIDPLGRFVEPKLYDDREWSCTETTNPQIPSEDSELICHGRPGGYKYCD